VLRERKPPPRPLPVSRSGTLLRVGMYRILPCLVMLRKAKKWSEIHIRIPINTNILSRLQGAPLARAYHAWSTAVNAFVSYLAHGITDGQHRSHNSALAEQFGLIKAIWEEMSRSDSDMVRSRPIYTLNGWLSLLPPIKEEVHVHVFAGVCLSVCLLARLLKNACMDLD